MGGSCGEVGEHFAASAIQDGCSGDVDELAAFFRRVGFGDFEFAFDGEGGGVWGFLVGRVRSGAEREDE